MKNREREICTSGSVRDEDGQPPLLGRRNFSPSRSGRCRAAGRIALHFRASLSDAADLPASTLELVLKVRQAVPRNQLELMLVP
jgi:hypothetical protein